MIDTVEIKKEFTISREKIFKNSDLHKDAFKFCIAYSLLIEEYVFKIFSDKKFKFVIASTGSFSRRELAPYSDIDIMFICESVDENEEEIQSCVRLLWDCGIEASHTVRDFSDVEIYFNKDLHAFTQFFETRFLLGSEKVFYQWLAKLNTFVSNANLADLVALYFEDNDTRHEKFGKSSKMLEPNLKYSAGGLRDLQIVGWIYSIKNKIQLTNQDEITQTEYMMKTLKAQKIIPVREGKKVLESYKFILNVRILLHLFSKQHNDRLEFSAQEKIGRLMSYRGAFSVQNFMKKYFESANIINRFSKTMIRRAEQELQPPLSDILAVELDEDFILKGSTLSVVNKKTLTLSEILRGFYYRGLHSARFDESLRSLIIESVDFMEETEESAQNSSVFFREILRLPKNVGETLFHMNELGILKLILPEFKDLIGYFQPGVYHNYTGDEHTIIAICNVESLSDGSSGSGELNKLFVSLKDQDKELLFLGILFHDIAKPISLSGHEIIGAEIASSVMYRLGYGTEESELVSFLVENHLNMEQVAFRRNLNDPSTLNAFTARFPTIKHLDLLYLVTFADLSAVNPMVWTEWKSELLAELYRKSRAMLLDQISGEDLLFNSVMNFQQKFEGDDSNIFQDHIESIGDVGYMQLFSEDEIASHIEEIEKGSSVSVFFKESNSFTNVTILSKDSPMLLSRLCGVLSINDLNIHDARIFTRKDGIVIDSFAVTDFRTHQVVSTERYAKITEDMNSVINNTLQLNNEFKKMKSKWWRIESKFFKRTGKVKIDFEDHEKYTILDVSSPDRLGLLYQVTHKMGQLGLSIYFAKIATKADDVVDSFYLLDRNGKKVSQGDYELIRTELTEAIEQIL